MQFESPKLGWTRLKDIDSPPSEQSRNEAEFQLKQHRKPGVEEARSVEKVPPDIPPALPVISVGAGGINERPVARSSSSIRRGRKRNSPTNYIVAVIFTRLRKLIKNFSGLGSKADQVSDFLKNKRLQKTYGHVDPFLTNLEKLLGKNRYERLIDYLREHQDRERNAPQACKWSDPKTEAYLSAVQRIWEALPHHSQRRKQILLPKEWDKRKRMDGESDHRNNLKMMQEEQVDRASENFSEEAADLHQQEESVGEMVVKFYK